MKKLLMLLFIFQIQILSAQEPLFVSAENGLIVRSGPDKSYDRIGKINYAEEIISYQNTNRPLEIVDDGVIIKGNWYRITANEVSGSIVEGYVFNGFLTSVKPKEAIIIKFENFKVEFEHIDLWNSEKVLTEIKKDTLKLNCDLTGTPENKTIKIIINKYKKIELYQRFQNSVTIMDEGPHCDLTEWKHYYSHWEKIPTTTKSNKFKALEYSKIDRSQFVSFQIEALKKAAEEHCGERWSNLLTEAKNIIEYPLGVSTSKVFIKIVITDENNKISEKIIEFTIPMGC